MSSSSVPFSCLQSFPASRSFPMNQFFASGAKVLEFSFSINPSNEYSGLISFRMNWLDLLAVQGTLKSLLQHQFKSINSLVLNFLYSPTLHPYMTTGKTIAFTRWTLVGEKSQQDGRRGEITYRIKPHTRQRCSECSNKPCAHQDPESPQRLRQNCV